MLPFPVQQGGGWRMARSLMIRADCSHARSPATSHPRRADRRQKPSTQKQTQSRRQANDLSGIGIT